MPDEQARAMFGCTEQALDAALCDKDPRDIAMYAMSTLSNAQELLQGGRVEWSVPTHFANSIRQLLNVAKYAIDRAVPRVAASNVATTATPVTVMGLCETAQLFLHPNQTYRFVVMPGCPRCAELARHADGPVGPAEPLDSIPAEEADGNGPKAPEAREP
jgi:hypothetical protein